MRMSSESPLASRTRNESLLTLRASEARVSKGEAATLASSGKNKKQAI
jgi:hypothetical protein